MTSIHAGPKTASSLAQVLFESSPNSGWMGPWSSLRQEQIDWWTHYAEIALAFVLNELATAAIDTDQTSTSTSPTEQPQVWMSAR